MAGEFKLPLMGPGIEGAIEQYVYCWANRYIGNSLWQCSQLPETEIGLCSIHLEQMRSPD